jgi:hypothetical protein
MCSLRDMGSAQLLAYMLVRQSGVVPMRPKYGLDALIATASNVVASISAQSDLNSLKVMSEVQHFALAAVPLALLAGVKGSVHLAARAGFDKMLVV